MNWLYFRKGLFVIFINAFLGIYGQNIDSLELAIRGVTDPVIHATLCNNLTEALFHSDPEKSTYYAKQAYTFSSIADDNKNRAFSLFWLARLAGRSNQADSSIRLFDEAAGLFKEINEPAYYGLAVMYKGEPLKLQLRFEEALQQFHAAATIFRDTDDQNNLAKAYNLIGGVYYDLNDLDMAFNYFSKMLSIMTKLDSEKGMAAAFNNVGEIYRLRGKSEKALEFYSKSVTINKKNHNLANLTANYNNIGNIWLSLGNPDSALHYFTGSYTLSRALDIPKLTSIASISLAGFYLQQGFTERAHQLYREAEESSKRSEDILATREATMGLSKTYALQNDYFSAYLYLNRYKQMNDSILQKEAMDKITRYELELEYQNQNRKQEVARRESGIRVFIVSALLVSMLIGAVLLYGRQRIIMRYARLEKHQITLEKEMIREDIDRKNRELTTSIMYIARKTEMTDHLAQKMQKSLVNFKPENQKVIRDVIKKMEAGAGDDIWKEFGSRFDNVHQGFFSKLKERFPHLTENDHKLCALLRLNLTTKEISSITHQNVRSIQVARTRLRNKLNIHNTDTDLIEYLSSL